MTKKKKIYQDPKKMLRSIVIGAGVIAAAYYWGPKAARALDARLQDADYAEEHHAMDELSGILEKRAANARREGIRDDEKDPFVQDMTRELKFRKKRHAAEKKNAKCKYCEAREVK